MRDGFPFIGRIPYTKTEPKRLAVANEVATMDFLRSKGLPVPEVYSYYTTPNNAAGVEYIFMERMGGTKLGDGWLKLGARERIIAVTELVEMEAKLFSLGFPASGSLHHAKDLSSEYDKIHTPMPEDGSNDDFYSGPETRLSLWYGGQLNLKTYRGTCTFENWTTVVSESSCRSS
jgi:hypothetical protein